MEKLNKLSSKMVGASGGRNSGVNDSQILKGANSG